MKRSTFSNYLGLPLTFLQPRSAAPAPADRDRRGSSGANSHCFPGPAEPRPHYSRLLGPSNCPVTTWLTGYMPGISLSSGGLSTTARTYFRKRPKVAERLLGWPWPPSPSLPAAGPLSSCSSLRSAVSPRAVPS
ncbi:hypothetical protein J6590_106606, partial [Homalodisca vitripennis]